MPERSLPHVGLRRDVPHQSSRFGSAPRIIVVHSTEGPNAPGLRDLAGLANWFSSRKSDTSSHVATDAEGNSARYVSDDKKAWHCKAYNRVSLGIEQIGWAAQTSWGDAQRRETARWIAYWSRLHGIPIHKATVADGQVVRPGVIRHSELGTIGGAHDDPGDHYPLSDVLDLARRYRELQGA
jgi:N-acetyl-anhydromuramyl-L-alanine amidase AmpD